MKWAFRICLDTIAMILILICEFKKRLSSNSFFFSPYFVDSGQKRKASLPDGLCLPFAFSHGTTVSVPQRETGCFLVRHQFQFITADEQLGSKQQLRFQNFNILAFFKAGSVESQENVLYYHRFQKSRNLKVLKVSI